MRLNRRHMFGLTGAALLAPLVPSLETQAAPVAAAPVIPEGPYLWRYIEAQEIRGVTGRMGFYTEGWDWMRARHPKIWHDRVTALLMEAPYEFDHSHRWRQIARHEMRRPEIQRLTVPLAISRQAIQATQDPVFPIHGEGWPIVGAVLAVTTPEGQRLPWYWSWGVAAFCCRAGETVTLAFDPAIISLGFT